MLSEFSFISLLGLFLLGSYGIMQLYITLLIRRHSREKVSALPPLRLFVPVRNEAEEIRGFLESISTQSISLQGVWGEDGSTDETPALLEPTLASGEWQLCQVSPSLHDRYPGKHAVLVALENKVDTPIFLLADADMRFPQRWAEGLASWLMLHPEFGGVCAPSLPRDRGLWSGFQRIEWAATLYLIAATQTRGQIVTAIGNSMAVRRSAWESIGGWRSLPPSLVEDYTFMRALLLRGWRFAWLFHPAVVGETRAEPTLRRWIHQRRRWRLAVPHIPPLAAYYWIVQSLLPWTLLMQSSLTFFLIWTAAEALPLLVLRRVLCLSHILRYIPLLLLYRMLEGVVLSGLLLSHQPIDWRGRNYRLS
ncbi:MAG: glycosyltransferase [Bacteroidia bacterium]|nr:glycosyltransferase [Bacteroidia bacterium]MDW8236656.1 glycosyltransferase family 2 protein [Bacteroidia bacterium]